MTTYLNLGGNSSIESYQYDSTSIIVNFDNGGSYLYNSVRPGAATVHKMKQLADEGQGLGTFINKSVRKNFYKKLS